MRRDERPSGPACPSRSELRPPFDPAVEHTSRYGPLYWSALAIGSAVMGFGVISVLSRSGSTHPTELATWVIGLALAHDLLMVPVVRAVATAVRRGSPRAARGLVLAALAVSAIIILFSIPFLQGWGLQPDNPSFLPRSYAAGLAITLAAVWVVTAAMMARRWNGR
jgi:hypothetical protein